MDPLRLLVLLIVSTHQLSEADGRLGLATRILKMFSRPFAPVSPSANISEECLSDSRQYLDELANDTLWAVKMFDASAKLQSGLCAGNLANYGQYEECLMAAGGGFRGQHCTAAVQLVRREDDELWEVTEHLMRGDPMWLTVDKTLRWGVCVPSSCTHADVEASLQELLLTVDLQLTARVRSQDCHVSVVKPFTPAERSYPIFLGAVFLLLVGATVYDFCTSTQESDKKEISGVRTAITAFSLRANCKKLFDMRVREGTMTCIHGIRALSMGWVILLHQFLFVHKSPLVNKLELVHYFSDNALMLFLNGSLATDSFLLLGGLLVSYTFFRQVEKRRFNLVLFYVCRYIRLTPPYAAVIFFYATLMYRMGDGPFWNQLVGTQRELCVKGWWTNLLYINNFLGGSRLMCMKPSWYLAVDMQLYLFSPLVLYPLWRRPRLGAVVLATALAASVAVPVAIVAAYGLPGMLPFRLVGKKSSVEDLTYLPPYTRASPYLVGVAFGYWLHSVRNKDVALPKWLVAVGWIGFLVVMSAVLQGGQAIVLETHVASTLESSVYAGFSRFAWSVGLAWLIFACVKGYGGPVNAFLSMSVMQPLSKLSYCVYLCHWMVLLIHMGSTRTPEYYSVYRVVTAVTGQLPLILCVSAAFCLAFEMPVAALMVWFMSRRVEQGAVTEGTVGTSSQQPVAMLDMQHMSKNTVENPQGPTALTADRLI